MDYPPPHHHHLHRDLARNWDIDIASSLEDYLDGMYVCMMMMIYMYTHPSNLHVYIHTELDNLKISLDGGQTNLNFAEAALLIQVGRCVCRLLLLMMMIVLIVYMTYIHTGYSMYL